MGLALWISQLVFRKNCCERCSVSSQIADPVWQRLNVAWIAFFAAMGLLNLVVAYNFSTAMGELQTVRALGLMLVFTVAQGLYLSRHPRRRAAGGGFQR